MASGDKHVALKIEVPAIYTADLDKLREYDDPEGTESDFLLNCIGEPSIVRLRVEISGEKDSSVEEVWGIVREAELVEPGAGFGEPSAKITDEQLADHGHRLMREEHERPCEWCRLPDEADAAELNDTQGRHAF